MSLVNSESAKAKIPIGVCIKVKYLRKRGYENLREWNKNPNNIQVTRHGRIFINKNIYVYKASLYANPFKLKDYSLTECLSKYKTHLKKMIDNDETFKNIFLEEMTNAKEIGCFCEPQSPCHRDVIIEVLSNELRKKDKIKSKNPFDDDE